MAAAFGGKAGREYPRIRAGADGGLRMIGRHPARRTPASRSSRPTLLRLSVLVFMASLGPSLSAARPQDSQDAQQQPLRHDIVVTATRIETPRREVASSITVVPVEALISRGRRTVAEALADVAGLSGFQYGGPGGAVSLSIRGANSEHTLVLLDGVEINDPMNPSRSSDLAHLSLAQVERLEVLRGPQSPLYGSDAMGGVVNIITRRGRGRPRFTLSGSAGSLASRTGTFGVSGSTARVHYAAGVSYYGSDGISAASSAYAGNSERDGYRNFTFQGRAGLTPGPNFEAEVVVRGVGAKSDLDGFGGPYGDDPNSLQDYRSALVRGQAKARLFSGRWEQTFAVSYVGAERRNDNPVDAAHPDESEKGLFESGLAKAEWLNTLLLGPSHTLVVGAEAERENGRSDYEYRSAWGLSESDFPSRTADNAAVFAQDQWRVAGRLFLTAGARVDRHSRAGTAFTYRLAPAFVVAETGTTLRATYGTAFKAPSLYQLLAPRTSWGPIGNPGLAPERAAGLDAEIEQEALGGRFVLSAGAFRTDFRNLIVFDTAAGYVNIGLARTRGLEFGLETRPLEGARLQVHYTTLESRDRDTGEALLRRPRNKLGVEAEARLFGKLTAAVTLMRAGSREDLDFSSYPSRRVTLAPYTLLGADLSLPVGGGLELLVRLDNLLGARYETVWGYGSPGFTAAAGFRLVR